MCSTKSSLIAVERSFLAFHSSLRLERLLISTAVTVAPGVEVWVPLGDESADIR